ncbi:3-deoxy-D-manno-octulosonic acid transferase [Brevundimonas sp. BAL450]|uniref:3-deoxy-D-manno-octulosonic acid transferase n=1 Tax=Brevundimonas TaxID=41275 RepID=UPI0018C925DB|nr:MULTISPECIES: 3-deoxy-D-manno-octulosonic acid transferase [Brevundimonas]MBG7614108.1 3-deoxy-D-manno-octulosonic acid transferase [Brevundimonas sp. BAL450]
MSLVLKAYSVVTGWLEPLAPRLLGARARRGKEDAARLNERLGRPSIPRPSGPLVWLHGVSVGESLSLLPVIARLRAERPEVAVLVTSGTVTSARILAERLPPDVIHQYAPVDGPLATARFLNHWRPSLGVLVESELWPNLIGAARARGVKLALISARITDKTAQGWGRMPGAAGALLSAFDLILPQDDASAARIEALGGQVQGRANLKLAGGPLTHDKGAFEQLSAAIGDRSVVLAASTHPGEERAIARALDALEEVPFLILMPRHPERGGGLVQTLRADGRVVAVRSAGETIALDTSVYLADTLGEMGLFLALADVVVMGGSFGPVIGHAGAGGHNPLEPARLGKPTVCGPDMANWPDVAADLERAGGLIRVERIEQLAPAVAPLLGDPVKARAMGERARRAAQAADAGLDRLWSHLAPLLPAGRTR